MPESSAPRFARPLSPEELRWRCDPGWLPFSSTEELPVATAVVGQDDAMEAMRFGLEIDAPGQNIFVRGLSGTGRMSLVQQLLETIQPACPLAEDRLYVHNFEQPERPRLISLPRGRGRLFQARIDALVEFIEEELAPGLNAEPVRARRTALDDRLQEEIRAVGVPFEEELQQNGLALVPVQVGESMQPVIMPVVEGEPAPPDRFRQLRQDGKVTEEQAKAISTKLESFSRRFQEVSEKVSEIQTRHRSDVSRLYEEEARALALREILPIRREFPHPAVEAFLKAVLEDLVGRRLRMLQKDRSFTRLYRVNLVLGHDATDPCPVLVENAPTVQNLLGTIEREVKQGNVGRSDHLMIRPGTLLRADGGYLILEARDLLAEPGAWRALVRTLRSGKLEIIPADFPPFLLGTHLKPEPIEVRIKVILLGDPDLYYMLDAYDPDFPHLFKVLADFDSSVPRDETGALYYARVMAKLAREEGLPHFSAPAVGALCEHGARIVARAGRLTVRFGRLADIAREAAHLARRRGPGPVRGEDVTEAIRRIRRRADLPARSFRRFVAEGLLRVETRGEQVGQINGLAVIHAGPLTYGFPSRITATIGPGTAGAINIEREAQLSGSIHTKGFYILGGLLRHLLRTDHPLAFSASVAFEQSYGGIDGDSASGAEACCLLSALTGVPLRQDLAMTGAIDQHGRIQPVGAVTEKIEGFFDTCTDLGITGTQGVIIPRANAGELMLRADVVEAAAAGRFHVHAVETVAEALEILTGRPAGAMNGEGDYPEGSLLHLARTKARDYWRMAAARTGETPPARPSGPA